MYSLELHNIRAICYIAHPDHKQPTSPYPEEQRAPQQDDDNLKQTMD